MTDYKIDRDEVASMITSRQFHIIKEGLQIFKQATHEERYKIAKRIPRQRSFYFTSEKSALHQQGSLNLTEDELHQVTQIAKAVRLRLTSSISFLCNIDNLNENQLEQLVISLAAKDIDHQNKASTRL